MESGCVLLFKNSAHLLLFIILVYAVYTVVVTNIKKKYCDEQIGGQNNILYETRKCMPHV